MNVLLVGTGGVGEAIAVIASRRDPKGQWLNTMVLADYSLSRAQYVSHGSMILGFLPSRWTQETKNS